VLNPEKRFGSNIHDITDVNSDGKTDYFVVGLGVSRGGIPTKARVAILSGKDGAIISSRPREEISTFGTRCRNP
jgi:hypothetical protein